MSFLPEYKKTILHLSLIKDIGDSTICSLVQQIGTQNLQDLYGFNQQDFERCGINSKKAYLLNVGLQDIDLLKQELLAIEKYKVSFITIGCDIYPIRLKNIHVPPVVLYYYGDISVCSKEKLLACVGARKAHRYTSECLSQIVKPLMQDDWVIVSGGALGADTFAHKMALEQGAKTIVVVGSGLAHFYPPQNKALFEQVVEQGGVIVSSFPVTIRPEAYCFPIRNRIISGLSLGCLVLQAAEKSGALITAQFALEQGREVFAVPGPIYDPLSVGCHELIKQGAKLVACSQDILDELVGFNLQQQSLFLVEQAPKVKVAKKVVQELVGDDIDRAILQHTIQSISIQELLSKVDVDLTGLHQKLFELSLDGRVAQDCMGLWKRV